MAKIRLKLNELEVECEARESFLRSELLDLVTRVAEKLEEFQGPGLGRSTVTPQEGDGSATGESGPLTARRPPAVTTKTIATRMSAKKAPDLARAAAVHLVIVVGKETFSRKELLEEMKTDTGRYNPSVRKNLTGTIKSLMESNVLNETVPGTYTLTPEAEGEMRKFLRDAQLL